MKLIINLFLLLLLSFLPLSMSVFSVWWTDKPAVILDELKDPDVQNTAIDNAGMVTWLKDSAKDWLKLKVVWYIQWIAYVWLGIALLAIIYNGIILLMNLGDKSKLGIVKKRLISITIWVVLVVWAYLILDLVLSLIWNLTP